MGGTLMKKGAGFAFVYTVKERYGENAELVRLPLEAADSSK